MNVVILIGRLSKDPEVRYTQSGKAVASFDLAVRKFAGEGVDFFAITVWGNLAETTGNNLSKGRLVSVQGRLNKRSYDGTDGLKKTIHEVVADKIKYLDKKPNGGHEVTPDDLGREISPEEDPF